MTVIILALASLAQTFDYIPPGPFPQVQQLPSPSGSVHITFKPHNDLSSITGRGRSYTIWSVSIISDYPVLKVVSRERIMAAAPSIPEIPGAPGQDLILRQASRDPHNVLLRFLDFLLPAVAAGATTYGLLKKIDWATGTGLGSAAIGWGRAEGVRNAPNVQPYLGDLLPKEISLAAYGSITYAVVATYDLNAHVVESTFQVP